MRDFLIRGVLTAALIYAVVAWQSWVALGIFMALVAIACEVMSWTLERIMDEQERMLIDQRDRNGPVAR